MPPNLSTLPTYPSPFTFSPTPLIPASHSLPLPTRKHARTNTLDILTLPACDPKRSRANPSALVHGADPLRFYIPAEQLVQPLPTVARPSLSSSISISSSSSSSSTGEHGQSDSESTLQTEGEEALDESDSTSSSSSSSSSEDEEDDSDDTDTDSHSSSTTHPAIQPLPPSTLHTRLSAFLPSLRAANQALDTERLAGTLDARNIETVGDEGEGGQYIEMDLGLGVLEEKRDGDDDSGSDESWSEIDGLEEEQEREKDVLGRLMGIRARKHGTKPGIEVLGGGAS